MIQSLWKTVWYVLKMFKVELVNDPAMSLLGMYPKELKPESQRVICAPMFIAALFTMAKSIIHNS